MKRLDQRIAEVEATLARLRHEAASAHRRDETRKKVLLGSWLQDWLARQGTPGMLPQGFSDWLTHDRDRRLFGLLPRQNQGEVK